MKRSAKQKVVYGTWRLHKIHKFSVEHRSRKEMKSQEQREWKLPHVGKIDIKTAKEIKPTLVFSLQADKQCHYQGDQNLLSAIFD